MKQYDTYKPSGIEWLGDIPEHWDVKRVKDLTIGITGFAFNSSKYSDSGIKLVRGINVKESVLNWNDSVYWPNISLDLKRFILKANDVLIQMDGSKVGKNFCIVKDADLPLLLVQRVTRLRSLKILYPQFLFYSIVSNRFYDWVSIRKTDPMVPHITLKDIEEYVILFASVQEQAAIANYLDTKTTAIDRKIELLTAKADKYKALRRTLINETVCRGLNPNAPLKDSGIEWIGMIPEHWEVKRVKDEINIINGFAFDSESYLDSGLPIIRIGDISNEIDFNEVKFISKENAIQSKYSRIKKYDILMAMTGATIGKNSYFQSDRVAYLNQRVCSFRVQNDSIPAFVKYYIESRFIQDLILLVSGGSAQDNISKYQLENFYIIIPPKNEQVEIANYLDSKTSKIDTILTNINKQITKLTQLRKTLINDVVTGKIKVTEVS